MRKLLSVTVLSVLSLVLFTGCPYESAVPLSGPGLAKSDSELIGKWRAEDKESKETGILTISRFNDKELLIVIDDGDKVETLRGFVTFIGNEKFLNVQEMREPYKDRKWMFANYSIKDCSLTYRLVNDSLLKDKAKSGLSQKELYAFIKKNIANKNIYDEPTTLTCVKIDAPGK